MKFTGMKVFVVKMMEEGKERVGEKVWKEWKKEDREEAKEEEKGE